MNSNQSDVAATLSEQCRRQVRLVRRRAPWLPWLFAIGLLFSAAALVTSIARFRDEGFPALKVIFLGFFVVYFGGFVGFWLIWPFRPRPRIVPYFARGLGKYGGKTSTAFARGRGLYRESVALDQLAGALRVKPLPAFGYADDYYGQEVHWHAASEGLRTVEALRQGLSAQLLTAPDVVHDLEALASVLRAAADQEVAFSLVLRLNKTDSIQAVSSMERRQGWFW